MAWEWVAPVAASVGAITTLLAAKGGRVHAETLARLNMEHVETMTREERRQQRFADAYVQLLEMLEHAGHWAHRVRPIMEPGPEVLPLPDTDKQARVKALVNAFGSPQVRQLLEEYYRTIKDILHADSQIEIALRARDKQMPTKIEYHEVWIKLDDELRPAERRKRKELVEKVAEELHFGG